MQNISIPYRINSLSNRPTFNLPLHIVSSYEVNNILSWIKNLNAEYENIFGIVSRQFEC